MEANLREKLKNRLVDLTCKLRCISDEKKEKMAGYTELIKDQKKRIDAISIAISSDDDGDLVNYYGEHYKNELGLN